MELNNEELEEILTINAQAQALLPRLSYTSDLENEILDCMRNKKELSREYIQKAHNNYLALCLIGFNQCDSEIFKKLENYMDNEY